MIILWKYIYKKINVPSSSTLDILFVNSPEPKETVVDLPSDLFHQKSPPFTAHSTQLKHLNDFGFLFVQIFAHVRGLNVLGYMLYVSTASSEQEMSKSCNKLSIITQICLVEISSSIHILIYLHIQDHYQPISIHPVNISIFTLSS